MGEWSITTVFGKYDQNFRIKTWFSFYRKGPYHFSVRFFKRFFIEWMQQSE